MTSVSQCPICNASTSGDTCPLCGWEFEAPTNGKKRLLWGAMGLVLLASCVSFFLATNPLKAADSGIRSRAKFLFSEEAAQENARQFASLTDEEVKQASVRCSGDSAQECEIKHWFELNRRHPEDPTVTSNLGIRLSRASLNGEALPYLKKAIELGAGGYDTFAWYSHALRNSGSIDDAIVWAYRCLDISPNLYDITESLAEMLVQQKRSWEALGLLAGFQAQFGNGREIFKSKMVAIASALPKNEGAEKSEHKISIPEVGGHHTHSLTQSLAS